MTKSLVVRSATPAGESESWRFAEFHAGINELDAGDGVAHDKVAQWIATWGQPEETRPPQ